MVQRGRGGERGRRGEKGDRRKGDRGVRDGGGEKGFLLRNEGA